MPANYMHCDATPQNMQDQLLQRTALKKTAISDRLSTDQRRYKRQLDKIARPELIFKVLDFVFVHHPQIAATAEDVAKGIANHRYNKLLR